MTKTPFRLAVPVSSPLLTGLIDYFSFDLASGGLTGLHDGIVWTNNGCTAGSGLVYASSCDVTDDGNYYLSSDDARLKAITTPGQSFEIAAWVYYRTMYETKPPYRAIITNSSFRKGFEIKGASDSLETAFIVGKIETNYFNIIHANPTPTGVWKLCHFHFDVGETVRLGASVNAAALSYTTPETGTAAIATASAQIGWNSANDHMDGMIGPMAIWSRKLTAGERTWLYNSGAGRTYAAIASWDGN